MKRAGKIRNLLCQENGSIQLFRIFKYKVRSILCKMKYGRKFKNFGRGSMLIKPDRIIGMECISIRGGVSILHHMWMEAVKSYGGKKFSPRIEIGERTSIGQNFHATAAGELIIGKNVTISGNVFAAACAHEYLAKDVHILRQNLLAEKTVIGDGSFIGFGACIMPGARLGKQNIAGSNCVVLKGEYPDYCVLAGVPARIVKKMNLQTGKWEKV